MAEKRQVRVAAVQIAPDLDSVAGTLERVLNAIADASVHNHELEESYRNFMDAIIQGVAKRIRSEIGKKRVKSLDPDGTAAALIWMSERYLNVKLGRQPQDGAGNRGGNRVRAAIRRVDGGQ